MFFCTDISKREDRSIVVAKTQRYHYYHVKLRLPVYFHILNNNPSQTKQSQKKTVL